MLQRLRDYEYRTVANEFRYRRCDGCDLIYLDPRPRAEDVPATYPPSYEQYAAGVSGWSLKRAVQALRTALILKPRMRRVLRLCARPGARVLDVGCGNGHSLAAVAEIDPRAELHGTDLGEGQRPLLEERGITYHRGAFEDLEVPAAHFDLILLNHVIEHFLDPLAVVEKVRRCLAPGGLLYLETHIADCAERRLFGRYWIGFDAPRHLTVFEEATLRRLMAAGGLEVVSADARILSVGDVIYSLRRRISAGRGAALRPLVSDRNPLLLLLSLAANAPRRALGRRTSVIRVVARRPELEEKAA